MNAKAAPGLTPADLEKYLKMAHQEGREAERSAVLDAIDAMLPTVPGGTRITLRSLRKLIASGAHHPSNT